MRARQKSSAFLVAAGIAAVTSLAAVGHAQLHDIFSAPNAENEGIKKTLAQQVGAGRGDINTPGSSIYIIERDPARSVRRGRQLFQRKFHVSQGFGPLTGDGQGNIAADGSIGAGLVDSCAGCHGRPRGAAGFGGDVFTRPDSRDAPHLFGLGLQEMIADEITTELRAIRDAAVAQCQQLGVTTQGFLQVKNGKVSQPAFNIDYGRVIVFAPSCTVDTSNVVGVNPDLRVRPFFAQGGTISMREFLVGAFNAEMGLESPDPDLLTASSGGSVVTPSGMVLNGAKDSIEAPPVTSPTDDADGDGHVNEIDPALVDHMEFYLLNYFKPGRGQITNDVLAGQIQMDQLLCTSCHIRDITIEHDRRVADVETVFNPSQGSFNRLFATAATQFVVNPNGTTDPIKGTFIVRNIHADFKRHRLGRALHERNFDTTLQRDFMTEPLWGVGSTPPYGHDGRSINLDEVILRHSGPGAEARATQAVNAWNATSETVRRQVRAYLASLVLFAPDDTASNLNPRDTANPEYPQRGHGSINLGALFGNPAEGE